MIADVIQLRVPLHILIKAHSQMIITSQSLIRENEERTCDLARGRHPPPTPAALCTPSAGTWRRPQQLPPWLPACDDSWCSYIRRAFSREKPAAEALPLPEAAALTLLTSTASAVFMPSVSSALAVIDA